MNVETSIATPNRTENSKDSKHFLSYIHNFRGIAIALILTLHTAISLPWSEAWQKKIVMAISTNGTVLFVLISGFLFFYLNEKKFNYYTYIKKKFLFVFTPYLIISIPALADKLFFDTGQWWMDQAYAELNIFNKLFYLILTGKHSGPLWFIPMIMVFFFISPLLIRYGRSHLSNYLTPIIMLAGLFTFQFGFYSTTLLSFLHFLPVYLFGMWFSKNRNQLINFKIFIPFLVAYMIITIAEVANIVPLDYYIELRDNEDYIFAFNISEFKALILSYLLVLIFKKYETRKFQVIKLFGDYSFGLFFLHIYIINGIQWLSHKGYFFNQLNVANYFFYLLVVIAINLVIIKVAKVILGRNSRVIIGS